ncbi:phosphoenolpyruvate--protein phosphotransferase [Enterovibrio norvegicus]|uniref:Phosphoenolpyruvate--protein phosphotransferase n=1 Tax=Enterovibrio norvegicus TaxID=188144 RepID=A0ABV4L1L1_9GAMM|nr:phosphoenolpyruvate--protein phosphotransferase [Enterovibrio norvegicus]MCC4800965.1 phosphoenolpyruvate--protein phosphotransferase [Enterovibrio norvegicus]TKF10763.1 phosphoenolpyruvate--protein phosphotransferase [Enterovibrio norvegicus]
MKKEVAFTCELPNGIHARPANHLEAVCRQFSSDITLKNLRNENTGSAKSVLSLVGTDTLLNDPCSLIIEGDDAEAAFDMLATYLREEFPLCDEEIVVMDEGDVTLPQSLMNHNPTLIRAKRLSAGIAKGKLIRYNDIELSVFEQEIASLTFEQAKQQVTETLIDKAELASGQEKEIIKAHLGILNDETLNEKVSGFVSNGESLAKAILLTVAAITETLMQSSSAYLKERVLDIKDIALQLLMTAHPHVEVTTDFTLTEPSIVIANDLTPSQFLGLDRAFLQGLILTQAGSTSHTVILARAFNIPAVSGVEIDACAKHEGETLFVDGGLGIVALAPSDAVATYFERAMWLAEQVKAAESEYLNLQAQTKDGHKIEIAANIACTVEAESAFAKGAEGIGLFRTEMLFMDRSTAPDEQEQFDAYKEVLEAAGDKAVIIRTMDIGGDKPLDYLNLPHEHNPFLGYRAVRIYPQFLALFHTQLRAILRAAQYGHTKVMIPMIQSIEEIRWVKAQLEIVKAELTNDNTPFGAIELGIMVEIPSVAFIMDQFCKEVDFFSIGSNDMTQYLLAVDRDNDNVAKLYNSLAPSFLRLLRAVVSGAQAHDKWVGLCGELGANKKVLPLLVGAGLNELSMAAPSIAPTKAALRQFDSEACKALFNEACDCATIADVEALLEAFTQSQEDKPLLDVECVLLDCDFNSKEEAIQTLVGNLGVRGRTHVVNELEADIWARESVFTTGLGNGFAIPHTKSDNIAHSSISIARLNKPVIWSDDEDGAVEFVIMLTLNKNQGDQHMRIFSGLARKLIHESFRNTLKTMTTEAEIISYLQSELSL